VLLFGLALMVGGAGVLVGFRDELGVRVPILYAIADLAKRAAPLARWLVRAVGLAPWPQPTRPRRPARAVGRAAVPAHTVVQHRLPQPPPLRAVGRASPPPSSLVRPARSRS
jgi:hypothetical protein